ncbi:MAG: glucose 1-dehydrogenase [Chloroflexi bacterium]|nr:glucose 1-dehydrogenase [Chloroflexota bacterium]
MSPTTRQQPSTSRLAGKVALVTGAARGIGRGIAVCFAEEGADVIVNDLPAGGDHDGGQDTAREIAALGRQAHVVSADISDRGAIAELFASGVNRFGGLDVVVANAAYSDRELVVDARWESVWRTLEVTQLGVFHTCQAAAQQMVKQGRGGKIIIIGSLLSEVPSPTSAAYNMAKAAVNHLGRTLANELAPHRINVNVINPGYIDTPGERKFATDEEIRRSGSRIPWGRLGLPRDIGRAAVYLASDDADYVTGTSLLVDGGYKIGMKLPPAV